MPWTQWLQERGAALVWRAFPEIFQWEKVLLEWPEAEATKVMAFRTDELRKKAAYAKMFLREVLSQHLKIDGNSIEFEYGKNGKPYLKYPSIDLFFNLTHTQTHVAVAVSTRLEVGVDLESGSSLAATQDWASLFDLVLTLPEATALRDLREGSWQSAFCRIWTRKEAVLKSIGAGLSLPMNSFSVAEDWVQIPGQSAHFELGTWETPFGCPLSVALCQRQKD